MKKIHFVILAELIIMVGCMFLCTLRIVGAGSLYGFTPVGVEIPVDDSSYGDFIHRERGIGLMARMKIPDGDVSLAYSSWSFPTSIIVNEVSYRVKQISQDGWFKVCSQTNSEDVLASGGLCRTTNAKIARVCGFGEAARAADPNRRLIGLHIVSPNNAWPVCLTFGNKQVMCDGNAEIMFAIDCGAHAECKMKS